MLPVWMARGAAATLESIENTMRGRTGGMSMRKSLDSAGLRGAPYQRLQYWLKKTASITKNARADWTALRLRMLDRGRLFGPFSSQSRVVMRC